MRKLGITLAALLFNLACISGASAAVFTLFECDTYKDGFVSTCTGDPTALTLSLTFTTSGAHKARAFVDAEIDEPINTFFNEYGEVVGTPPAGQSWEIDEPGFVFGDIWTNFSTGALDNSNGVPSGAPEDVSMALGWDFILTGTQSAVARFFVADSLPVAAAAPTFYLSQVDPDSSNATLYFWSTLDIRATGGGDPGDIPEPATLALLGLALTGMLVARRKFAKG